MCYLEGWGVQKNEKEAHRLFLLAAEGGVPGAYVNLANMYLLGTGVSVDLIEAYKWIAIFHGGNIPAENGWKSDLESKMSTAEITEARKRIQAWIEMHPLKSN
ncbi:sel1 repeat family protein [Permianibacter sp. IMCC34836]|uniref:tetratricopeptide repeat protein n=1 Tax=Permianibacter fluminis TaxID=2738515 RepID=UPI001555A2D1|nr:SEL1-like repeat protein [Permianibacter fluminis]NQD37373.1 sel1 repeat family protein [Permianibacter fluminis]